MNWFQQGYQYSHAKSDNANVGNNPENHFKISENLPYLNNYAYALASLGCGPQANILISRALAYEPGNANLLDTQKQIPELIQKGQNRNESAATQCPLIRWPQPATTVEPEYKGRLPKQSTFLVFSLATRYITKHLLKIIEKLSRHP